MITHEQYISEVARIVTARLAPEEQAKIAQIKLVYGAGAPGLRGVTYFDRWGHGGKQAPFVEVCAFGQDSALQVAGTTIHELGHVVAGWEAGHGADWKAACERLGLRRIMAAGTAYKWSMVAPDIRAALALLPQPDEGAPVSRLTGPTGKPLSLKPCGAATGTRGGKSRGVGSGSRMKLYHCECEPPVKIRHAGLALSCHCDHCAGAFNLA